MPNFKEGSIQAAFIQNREVIPYYESVSLYNLRRLYAVQPPIVDPKFVGEPEQVKARGQIVEKVRGNIRRLKQLWADFLLLSTRDYTISGEILSELNSGAIRESNFDPSKIRRWNLPKIEANDSIDSHQPKQDVSHLDKLLQQVDHSEILAGVNRELYISLLAMLIESTKQGEGVSNETIQQRLFPEVSDYDIASSRSYEARKKINKFLKTHGYELQARFIFHEPNSGIRGIKGKEYYIEQQSESQTEEIQDHQTRKADESDKLKFEVLSSDEIAAIIQSINAASSDSKMKPKTAIRILEILEDSDGEVKAKVLRDLIVPNGTEDIKKRRFEGALSRTRSKIHEVGYPDVIIKTLTRFKNGKPRSAHKIVIGRFHTKED